MLHMKVSIEVLKSCRVLILASQKYHDFIQEGLPSLRPCSGINACHHRWGWSHIKRRPLGHFALPQAGLLSTHLALDHMPLVPALFLAPALCFGNQPSAEQPDTINDEFEGEGLNQGGDAAASHMLKWCVQVCNALVPEQNPFLIP